MSGGSAVPRKRRRSSIRKKTEWQKSLAFKEVGRKAITDYNRKRSRLPKCGAKAKSAGSRCGNLAMPNGKCWCHGGLTPAGDQWGRLQFRNRPPSRQAPSDWRKVEAKLKRRQAEEKDRARRLAAMTPEQRAAYEKRRRTHRPGTAAAREAARERRRQDDDFRERVARLDRPKERSPELQVLDEDIARLRAEQARRAKLAQSIIDEVVDADAPIDLGVFG